MIQPIIWWSIKPSINNRKYICDKCGQTFYYLSSLETHKELIDCIGENK